MNKILKIVLVIIAIVALFAGSLFGQFAIYAKVLGLCAIMFLLFKVNSKLSSKKEDTSKNLKL